MLYYFRIFLLFLFLSIGSELSAQDTLFTVDGKLVEGLFQINYNSEGDYLTKSGDDTKIYPSLFEMLKKDGFIYKPIIIKYYSTSTDAVNEKAIIVKNIIDAQVSIFEYSKSDDFSLIVSNPEQVFALQKFNLNAQKEDLKNYIEVLNLLNLDCVPNKEVYNAKLNRRNIIYLVDQFNLCNDPNYNSEIVFEIKKRIIQLSASMGVNYSTITVRIPYFELVDRGGFLGYREFQNSKSIEHYLAFSIHKNLFSRDDLFIGTKVASTSYNYPMEVDDSFSSTSLDVTEINILLGAKYEYSKTKIRPSIFSGIYAWLMINQNDVGNKYLTSGDREGKTNGANLFLNPALSYPIGDAIFIKSDLIFFIPSRKNIYTRQYKGNYEQSSDTMNNFVFTVGLQFNLSSTSRF